MLGRQSTLSLEPLSKWSVWKFHVGDRLCKSVKISSLMTSMTFEFFFFFFFL
jgi:hypothetical protein